MCGSIRRLRYSQNPRPVQRADWIQDVSVPRNFRAVMAGRRSVPDFPVRAVVAALAGRTARATMARTGAQERQAGSGLPLTPVIRLQVQTARNSMPRTVLAAAVTADLTQEIQARQGATAVNTVVEGEAVEGERADRRLVALAVQAGMEEMASRG